MLEEKENKKKKKKKKKKPHISRMLRWRFFTKDELLYFYRILESFLSQIAGEEPGCLPAILACREEI